MVELPYVTSRLISQAPSDLSKPLSFCYMEVWLNDGQVMELWVYHPDWFWKAFESNQINYWKEKLLQFVRLHGVQKINYCLVTEAIRQINEAGQWTLSDNRCVELKRVATETKKVLRICMR